MTVLTERRPPPGPAGPTGWARWALATDHRTVGTLQMATAFGFLVVGGVMAMVMRAELAEPGHQLVSPALYNQLFTMHGSVMVMLFAIPMALGLGLYLVPPQSGAPGLAFPRTSAFAYWLFLGGGTTMLAGFAMARGAASFAWWAAVPLSGPVRSPGLGADLWVAGTALVSLSVLLGAISLLTTLIVLQPRPRRGLLELPVFTSTMAVTCLMWLVAMPVMLAACGLLHADRQLGGQFFGTDPGGGPQLWSRVFWFAAQPILYSVALPFYGAVGEVLVAFAKRAPGGAGRRGMVLGAILVAGASPVAWAQGAVTVGAVGPLWASAVSFLLVVPFARLLWAWVSVMGGGTVRAPAPMLFAVGAAVVLVIGVLAMGVDAFASVRAHTDGTYFAVARSHYGLFGAALFGMFAALYFWWPAFTGRTLREGWAHVHFWLLLAGFNATFWPQFVLGLRGMPKGVADYDAAWGWGSLNLLSTLGAGLTAVAMVAFVANVWLSSARRQPVGPGPGWGPWAGQGSDRPRPGAPVQPVVARRGHRLAGGVALAYALAAGVYWLSTREMASTVLLAGTALAVTTAAVWLWSAGRSPLGPPCAAVATGVSPPSPWPLVGGAGLVGVAGGLTLGPLVFVTGMVMATWAAAGAAREAHQGAHLS